MKFLIFGDIYGKKGRQMLEKHLPDLRATYSPDVTIANVENISHGRGPKLNQIHWLEKLGIDIFTGGNHSFEGNEDVHEYMNTKDSRLLRPINACGKDLPGSGERIFTFGDKKILVINILGVTFMKEENANPFVAVDTILQKHSNESLEAILVDFHKEVTSEGYAMAIYLDGRVSFLFGTHTHVQTADAEIWPKGMGFISDIGFAGARHSLIGVEWETSKHRFLEGRQEGLLTPDEKGLGVLSGVFVEVIAKKCVQLEAFRICE